MRYAPRITWLALVLIAIVVSGCSQTGNQMANLDIPEPYDSELLQQYGDHIDAGYQYLENNHLDSAVASFAAMAELIPNAKYNHYHMACAYGRTGDKEKALEQIGLLVDAGWEKADDLLHDSDLEILQDDTAFEALVEKSRTNGERSAAKFTARMPEYDQLERHFDSLGALDAWYDSLNSIVRGNGRVWRDSEALAAKIDLTVRYLACLNDLKKDSAGFDYGLERVKYAARLKSPYDAWGPVAECVVNEVDHYLTTSPSEEGADVANFMGGFAWTARTWDTESPLRAEVLSKSNEYLKRVSSGSEYDKPALTLLAANNMELAGDGDKSQYNDEVKVALEGSTDNSWVKRIVSTRFQHDAINAIWPVEFEATDLDGKDVKLSDYDGKVLLIDFWATWCPPCRAELPTVVELYNEHHKAGFEILSVSFDYEDRMPLDSYKVWIDSAGLDWRHVYEGSGWGSTVGSKYFVSSIPAPFMVGKDGKLFASGEDCRGSKLGETIEAALAN